MFHLSFAYLAKSASAGSVSVLATGVMSTNSFSIGCADTGAPLANSDTSATPNSFQHLNLTMMVSFQGAFSPGSHILHYPVLRSLTQIKLPPPFHLPVTRSKW